MRPPSSDAGQSKTAARSSGRFFSLRSAMQSSDGVAVAVIAEIIRIEIHVVMSSSSFDAVSKNPARELPSVGAAGTSADVVDPGIARQRAAGLIAPGLWLAALSPIAAGIAEAGGGRRPSSSGCCRAAAIRRPRRPPPPPRFREMSRRRRPSAAAARHRVGRKGPDQVAGR